MTFTRISGRWSSSRGQLSTWTCWPDVLEDPAESGNNHEVAQRHGRRETGMCTIYGGLPQLRAVVTPIRPVLHKGWHHSSPLRADGTHVEGVPDQGRRDDRDVGRGMGRTTHGAIRLSEAFVRPPAGSVLDPVGTAAGPGGSRRGRATGRRGRDGFEQRRGRAEALPITSTLGHRHVFSGHRLLAGEVHAVDSDRDSGW